VSSYVPVCLLVHACCAYEVDLPYRCWFVFIAAGDIWSENGIALLGVLLYMWEEGATSLTETLVRAAPFGGVAHTGDEIQHATKAALALMGVGEFISTVELTDSFQESTVDTVCDYVHKAVADGASNMQKGMSCFETSPCPAHLGQRCVIAFFNVPRLAQTKVRTKGIAAVFRRSPLGLSCLHQCQERYSLPQTQPPRSVEVRWNSTFLQWEWFPVQQRALQMFDVQSLQLNMSSDDQGSTYHDFQLDLTDWQIIEHSVRFQPAYFLHFAV